MFFNLPNDSFPKCSCRRKLHCDSQANFFFLFFFLKSQLKSSLQGPPLWHSISTPESLWLSLAASLFSSPNVLWYNLRGCLPHSFLWMLETTRTLLPLVGRAIDLLSHHPHQPESYRSPMPSGSRSLAPRVRIWVQQPSPPPTCWLL